ncbi:MAG TPA: TetR/AcrR family transcriptional regulator [Deltaproteobacteria bacterium]|nr:TetR/AcrR family transcriptional regulator [Deltaproteobacteria bacterium]
MRTTDPTEPLLEERARRIVEATIELAEEGGFEAVRLRDVAARAEVAMGTLYRRFRSKEDLLVAALELETRALEDRVRRRPPKGARAGERAVGFFEITTRGMVRRSDLSRAMLKAAAAGEPALAEKVEIFHDMMLRMIVGALRGEPLAAGDRAISDRERLLGEVLNHVWFALMVGWSGGLQTPASVNERMRASVELILPEAGAPP